LGNKTIRCFWCNYHHKKRTFKDSAITSRSIIIRTKYKVGHYKIESFRKASDILSKFASKIKLDEIKETSQRVRNNWMPLQLIAEYINDEEWLKYSEKEIKKSTRVLKAGHSYEPDISILLVLKEKMEEARFRDDVLLSEIKSELKTQYDLALKSVQIQEYLRELGFKVVSHSGYPKVKFNRELLVKQLKDRQ
jgi:transposase